MIDPFISICIPAYKNAAFLEVLLHSIAIQSFRDFEVVISDDSPDFSVEVLVKKYESSFKIVYIKNNPALGSPANWNKAIRKATGKWIKIMHDDDWFSGSESLQKFVDAIKSNPDVCFLFSDYASYRDGDKIKEHSITGMQQWLLKKSALNLFQRNYIGPPSVTILRNEPELLFDEKTKWVVDFEFYIRYLKKYPHFFVIHEPLVNIGMSDVQITSQAFGNIAIELPENIYLLETMGVSILKNPIVFDHFWRLLRNLKVDNTEQLIQYAAKNQSLQALSSILSSQKYVPKNWIRNGVLSKMSMSVAYLKFCLRSNF